MKFNSDLKKRIKSLYLFFFSLLFFLYQINTHITEAIAMDQYKKEFVTEELRLKVPAQYKEVWLSTEKQIWDPWLSSQDGFLGRQLFCCLLYTSPSPRDRTRSRMPSSA